MCIAGHELVLEVLLEGDGSKQTLKARFNKTFGMRLSSTNTRNAQYQYDSYSSSFMTNGRKVTFRGYNRFDFSYLQQDETNHTPKQPLLSAN